MNSEFASLCQRQRIFLCRYGRLVVSTASDISPIHVSLEIKDSIMKLTGKQRRMCVVLLLYLRLHLHQIHPGPLSIIIRTSLNSFETPSLIKAATRKIKDQFSWDSIIDRGLATMNDPIRLVGNFYSNHSKLTNIAKNSLWDFYLNRQQTADGRLESLSATLEHQIELIWDF
jgi:hypothetical protein